MMNLYNSFEDEDLNLPQEVPLFPLQGTVLLPGEPLPLHIFEERYKMMTETALASERLIVMGHEKTEEGGLPPAGLTEGGPPRVYKVAGLGKITMEERLEDGRFNLLLVGVRRVRIGPVLQGQPYPRARVESLQDSFSQTSSTVLNSLESEILSLARKVFQVRRESNPAHEEALQDLGSLPAGELPLGALSDLVAAALFLPPMEKQMILEETDVVRRAEKLLFLLKYRFHSRQAGTEGLPSALQ